MEEDKFIPFRNAGIIILLFFITTFFLIRESKEVEEAFIEPKFVYWTDHGHYGVILIVVILIIAIISYITAEMARQGSLRATIVALGFLFYFIFSSLIYIVVASTEGALFIILAYLLTLGFSIADLWINLDRLNPRDISDRIEKKTALTFMTVSFFLLLIFLLVVRFFDLPFEFTGYFAINASKTILSGQGFEIAPFTSHEATPYILIPVLFFASILIIFKRPWGFVLSPILLVMSGIQSVYIVKMITFGFNILNEVKKYGEIFWTAENIQNLMEEIISYGLSSFIRLVVALTAAMLAFIFLINIKKPNKK